MVSLFSLRGAPNFGRVLFAAKRCGLIRGCAGVLVADTQVTTETCNHLTYDDTWKQIKYPIIMTKVDSTVKFHFSSGRGEKHNRN